MMEGVEDWENQDLIWENQNLRLLSFRDGLIPLWNSEEDEFG